MKYGWLLWWITPSVFIGAKIYFALNLKSDELGEFHWGYQMLDGDAFLAILFLGVVTGVAIYSRNSLESNIRTSYFSDPESNPASDRGMISISLLSYPFIVYFTVVTPIFDDVKDLRDYKKYLQTYQDLKSESVAGEVEADDKLLTYTTNPKKFGRFKSVFYAHKYEVGNTWLDERPVAKKEPVAVKGKQQSERTANKSCEIMKYQSQDLGCWEKSGHYNRITDFRDRNYDSFCSTVSVPPSVSLYLAACMGKPLVNGAKDMIESVERGLED
jgi:hypothetical protein